MKPSYTTTNIAKPEDGKTVYLSHYWVCKNCDPKQAVLYGARSVPQCHKNFRTANQMLSAMQKRFPDDLFGIVYMKFGFVYRKTFQQ